ncbi:hypothetical protein [Dactylosporangium matsuzakiense]|uniref:Ig-like domain-containing protein n=1 Tax=Dactylosporangium matsuzakiense TaxID=53360 RepID=A0A9W6NJ54_9ACTN|nr:hypothetical protein [Dactylosporangium matsuzakiense]UWZ47222.1 hypothetical protein Dmats_12920 [Dactylosporangium matsuzakiense]GLK98331.1 hypothetical protein GCM10017581_000720 [Dactylosporangium matsuzakiense]
MRRSASIALACAAGAAAILPAAAPAAAATPELGLVVPVLAPMLPGQTGWVGTMWAASKDVCDLKVTASGTGVTVKYPANTATYSSLSKGDSLKAGQLDYAAFNVSLPSNTLLALVPLKLSYTYTVKADGASDCTGTDRSGSVTATLPVVSVTGDAVVQKTSAVTVPKATPVWSQLVFQSRKSGVDNLQVTVTGGPTGLVVSYPQNTATYTSLSKGSSLAVGTDDFAAVKFDATNVAAGTYKLTVNLKYGSTTDTNDLTLVVS